jgi:hypothetical protein
MKFFRAIWFVTIALYIGCPSPWAIADIPNNATASPCNDCSDSHPGCGWEFTWSDPEYGFLRHAFLLTDCSCKSDCIYTLTGGASVAVPIGDALTDGGNGTAWLAVPAGNGGQFVLTPSGRYEFQANAGNLVVFPESIFAINSLQ